jgi:hypothetical protein
MVSLAIDGREHRLASVCCSLCSFTVATPVTPVAVIGKACRLPGGIDSPELLREALLSDDLVTEISPYRSRGTTRSWLWCVALPLTRTTPQ